MSLDYIHKTSTSIEAFIGIQILYAVFMMTSILFKVRVRTSKQSVFGKEYVIDPQTSQNLVIS